MQDAASAMGNGMAMPTADRASIGMQISGEFNATIAFEGTVDESNWLEIQTVNLGDGSTGTTAMSAGIYVVACAGLSQVRARISEYSQGSITVIGLSTDAGASMAFAGLAAAAATADASEAAEKRANKTDDLLCQMLIEMRIGNLHLASITDEHFAEEDIE